MGALLGTTIIVALLVAALLGWVAELKQSRGSVSAREHRDQSERIRGAYMSKEQRAREMRERIRRERVRRERAREAQGFRQTASAGGGGGGGPRTSERVRAPRTTSAEERHRTTLELVGEITPDRLRRNYRRLVAAYHPDRVAGLGEKLQRLAEEETKSINEAYSFFKKQLGV